MIWKKWARLSCTCTGTETKRLGLIKNRQYVSSIRGGWYGHIGFVRQFGRYEDELWLSPPMGLVACKRAVFIGGHEG